MDAPKSPLPLAPVPPSAKDRLIVALDFPSAAKALALADQLAGSCRWAKVGLELYLAAGNPIVAELKGRGFSIFLDLKLHDIPNTVAGAVRSAAQAGASLLTLHAAGGPAMLRAAAKNHAHVAVVVDPADYATLIEALRNEGGTSLALRRRLAAKAYAHTARYDGLIADWLGAQIENARGEPFAPTLHLALRRARSLRYGENPHQAGALYLEAGAGQGLAATARVLGGKELSYNNLADADAALECVKAFQRTPACVIVKHGNPCGVALGADIGAAYQAAYACDPTSAFGGIIAFNQALDGATAQAILAQQFVEVVLAPDISAEAQAALAKKPNVRVLATGAWPAQATPVRELKRIAGGYLVQDSDRDTLLLTDLKVVTRRVPSADELRDLLFAWHVAMYVKSNAIVYARGGHTLGIGAGQTSRVISARIAALKAAEAGLDLSGAVLASDAFFPFRDGIDAAAAAGLQSVIQPGGSLRDAEVIAAADAHGMAMVFTGVRHFRH